MRIAIASGKGGTGKTTISLALSTYLASQGKSVSLADCDVEEPNDNLFLKVDVSNPEEISTMVPKLVEGRCTGCGQCESICAFNCIAIIKGSPLIFPDMCHSCNGCILVCPEQALEESQRPVGVVEKGAAGKINFTGGRLHIGQAMSPPLIKAVKERMPAADVEIVDAPPGTSCPVIESVKDCDFVILITEPTPFGLHDLKLAVGMARELKLPFGVVINRDGIGDDRVVEYCEKEGVECVARFAYSREIAEAYSKGNFMNLFVERYGQELQKILDRAAKEAK